MCDARYYNYIVYSVDHHSNIFSSWETLFRLVCRTTPLTLLQSREDIFLNTKKIPILSTYGCNELSPVLVKTPGIANSSYFLCLCPP